MLGTQIALDVCPDDRGSVSVPEKVARSAVFLGLKLWPKRLRREQTAERYPAKAGDRYLRTMMVQGAHYKILGPFGEDSDLRRWGLKLAERGGKNAKKRAVVAVARKLAILLHRLWVSRRGVRTTAQ